MKKQTLYILIIALLALVLAYPYIIRLSFFLVKLGIVALVILVILGLIFRRRIS